MSCWHAWECDIQISHCQVCRQLVKIFQKLQVPFDIVLAYIAVLESRFELLKYKVLGWRKEGVRKNPRGRNVCRSNPLLFPYHAHMGEVAQNFDRCIYNS